MISSLRSRRISGGSQIHAPPRNTSQTTAVHAGRATYGLPQGISPCISSEAAEQNPAQSWRDAVWKQLSEGAQKDEDGKT